jgi:uncharacterized protein YhbP (UPF0306 family)
MSRILSHPANGKIQIVIAALLKSESTLALATSGEDGAPHVAPLFYIAGEDLELCWFSSPSSRHSLNLEARSGAAVTVYRSTAEWKDICGVQMRGTVSIVVDATRRAAVTQAYTARFRLGAQLQDAIASSSLYSFRPAWIRYLDNSLGFGYKSEFAV